MPSSQEIRNMLLLSFNNKFITMDEFVLLYDANSSKNLIFPHKKYSRFNLDEMDETECINELRFCKMDIPRLADALGLPDTFQCYQRSKAGRIEGLCMLLKKLTYPSRLSDMVYRFGRAVPEISMITNVVEEWIFENHHQKITEWNENLLNPANLQLYADAVKDKGAVLTNCFGFIDGTCRPEDHQKLVYNGHKRVHALKFQSLTIPSGLIAHLFGPVGR